MSQPAELSVRQRAIVDQLQHHGFIATVDLAEEFGVSDMTIRRDAKRIAEAGHARVVHGVISATHVSGHSAFFAARAREHAAGKRRIAAACIRLLSDRDVILLDAGTTTYEIANALPSSFLGTVITNSLPAVYRTRQLPAARTICLGGELLKDSQAFIAPMPLQSLQGLRASIAFIGISGVGEGGCYIEREYERDIKLAAMAAADRVVVVATHDKMARSALAHLAQFSEIDFLITDAEPPAGVRQQLANAGTELIVASERHTRDKDQK